MIHDWSWHYENINEQTPKYTVVYIFIFNFYNSYFASHYINDDYCFNWDKININYQNNKNGKYHIHSNG